MQCKYCGANLQEGAAFCMNCGKNCNETTPVQPTVSTQGMLPLQQANSTVSNGMQPMNNQNDNKKMYITIGVIILVAVIAIIIVLVINKDSGNSISSNSNTQSNTNSASNINSSTNSNDFTNSNFNSNEDDNSLTVSGGEINFNGYQLMIPSNYKATVEYMDYVGDSLSIENKENYNYFDIGVEDTSYTEIKKNVDALKKEISDGDYYTVGEFQYKNYNGKEYMITSRTSTNSGITHMIAYVALNDLTTLVIDATKDDYKEDYEIFSEIAPILASAH